MEKQHKQELHKVDKQAVTELFSVSWDTNLWAVAFRGTTKDCEKLKKKKLSTLLFMLCAVCHDVFLLIVGLCAHAQTEKHSETCLSET